MLKQSNGLVVFKAFGDEDEGQEPGAQNVNITETPEFQAALAAETAGLKNKNAEILAEKRKVQEQERKVQEQLNAILAQAEDKEDQEALRSGKLDVQSLLDKRLNANNASWQERLQAEQAEKEEFRKIAEAEKDRLKQFQIKQLIGTEFLRNEFAQPTAHDDVLNLAGSVWDISENGELVSRDQAGNVRIGKSGKPLTPKEWIEDLAGSRPHYFKALPGSGGKQGSGGGAKTMSSEEFKNLLYKASDKEKKELIRKRMSGEIVAV